MVRSCFSLRSTLALVAALSALNKCDAILVANAINLSECYALLIDSNSDQGNTNRIDEEEFTTFLKKMDVKYYGAPGILDGRDTFAELPGYAIETYDLLKQVCPNDPLKRTCAAQNADGLLIPTPPRTDITENPELYLFNICFSGLDTVEHVANSNAPSLSPAPSQLPTSPTAAPTQSPTTGPTASPSSSPTTGPTVTPTSSPTESPTTAEPTTSPTASPTKSPVTFPTTSDPTPQPTTAPTSSPVTSPTKLPTVSTGSPTKSPSIATDSPTASPTTSIPTVGPTGTAEASAEFDLQLALIDAGDLDPNVEDDQEKFLNYWGFVQIGMGGLALELPPNGGAQGTRLRALGVRARKVFNIEQVSTFPCPTEHTSDLSNPLCVDLLMSTTVQVYGQSLDDSDAAVDAYVTEFMEQVDGGKLQSEIDDVSADGIGSGKDIIKVLNGLSSDQNGVRAAPTESADGGTLSSKATAGVVSAAMLAVLVPFALLFLHRNRSQDEEKNKVFYEPYDPDDNPPSEIEPDADSMDPDLLVDRNGFPNATRGISTLGASRANYGMTKSSRKVLEAMEAGEDIVAEPEFDAERDSSSNAGSSGWSSSAGISSYNTGSMDDSMDAAYATGTTLAAIGGVTSALTKHMSDGRMSDGTSGASPSISRDQLDSFIEAGDWAAVGATAALLAAASDSQSASTNPSKKSRSSAGTDSLEAARAAELDHLVDAGDWEGVVLAAARFEAAETTVCSRGSRTASSVDSTGSASGTASRTIGSATASSPSESESQSMSRSDDPSRARQRREIRAEVEALVRRVVPEEIDNVDEMMNQFKGREEELVETLRTMQERAIAQKARTAGQKTAKLEARMNVKRGVVPGSRPPPAEPPRETSLRASKQSAPVPIPAPPSRPSRHAVARSQSQSVSSQSGTNSGSGSGDTSTIGSLKETRTALENAINAGDWEAVGQAAAFLKSDGSVNTTGTAERNAQSNVSTTSGSTRTRQTKDSETAVRQQELDEMISRGDWNGVMTAANRFSQMDKRVKSEVGRTPEEEDALEQAKMWANIANQTRAHGANDAGARDAADWAIQRSLSQMNKKDNSPTKDSDVDEV